MRRAFVKVGGRQVHYRTGGTGAPVVLLHPSPQSSVAVLPVARALETRFRVYALDTPGYGLSDPPDAKPSSLEPYLPLLAATLDALGLRRVCLYGAATGAQIGVEFAKRYPERVALLVLDSAGHFDTTLIERVVADYFPSVEPRGDGGHLMTVWNMVRDLAVFFPWCEHSALARVQRDAPPAAALHAVLLDYLRAGSRYDWAYRPAFYNENAARTAAVGVPTALVRWSGSLLLPQTDALIGHALPANFEVLRLDGPPESRLDGIAAYLGAHYRGADAPPLPDAALIDGRLASQLAAAGDETLHLRVDRSGAGRPLVLVHDAGSAADVIEALRDPARRGRPLVLVDLPGHGESDAAAPPPQEPGESARKLLVALEALGLQDADFAGVGLGACVALEAKLRAPDRSGSVTLIDPPSRESTDITDGVLQEAHGLVPRPDGTHLFAAWSRVRDAALWSPWFRRGRAAIVPGEPELSPEALHREVVALMKALAVAAAALQARRRYDVASRVRLARDPGAIASVAAAPARPAATLRRLLNA